MKADRFYSVPLEGRCRADVQALRMACGGLVAYARWHVLLELLYSNGGVVDNSSEVFHNLLLKELECDEETFTFFIETACELGMLELSSWRRNKIVSRGVCDQIEWERKQKYASSKAGKASAEARKKQRPVEQPVEQAVEREQ